MDDDVPGDVIRHAYVHVPFCPQICPFCSFHVLRRTPGAPRAYLDRLDAEAASLADRFDVALDTTYLGGGTPSMLRTDEAERMLNSLRRRFGSLGSEVTLEIHPSTATVPRLAAWRDLGVTRFSVGVESTDDHVLGQLGRSHSAASGLAAVDAARSVTDGVAGATVSVDLMCGIEGQDVASELARAVGLGVDHVSCYTLTIEEGTQFQRDGVVVDPDVAADDFDAAGRVLGAAGIARYEISNHARPGHEGRHNLGYWRSDWWLGLGPSAAAHLPPTPGSGHPVAVRAVNRSLGDWLDGEAPEVEALDGESWVRDALVAGLRPVAGVDLAGLAVRAGFDVVDAYDDRIAGLVRDGLVSFDGVRLAATATGARVLDRVSARLLR